MALSEHEVDEEPLDDEQRAAVEAPERAIAVLAGPGSGKTRVLSYRARYLLQQDREAKALLLTFTNKAAAEMKARALDVAVVTSDRIWASTFHTFGMRLLHGHGDLVGLERDFEIPDEEALPWIFTLLEKEGLCLGGSTGINVAGAVRLAQQMGRGHVIVTILADYGTRYQSKLFNPEFLRSKKLPVPAWLEKKSNVEIPFEKA